MQNNTEYDEVSLQQKAAATQSLLTSGCQKFTVGIEAITHGGLALIRGTNAIREAGLDFIAARGHQQLTFDAHTAGWFEAVSPWLDSTVTLAKMQLAVRVARALPEPVKTLEAARPALQCVFEAADIIKPTHRIEAQVSHERNLFCAAISGASSLASTINRLFKQEPMDRWDVSTLEQFVRNMQPVRDQLEAAEELLARKIATPDASS